MNNVPEGSRQMLRGLRKVTKTCYHIRCLGRGVNHKPPQQEAAMRQQVFWPTVR
jgi:hypothetical protein